MRYCPVASVTALGSPPSYWPLPLLSTYTRTPGMPDSPASWTPSPSTSCQTKSPIEPLIAVNVGGDV